MSEKIAATGGWRGFAKRVTRTLLMILVLLPLAVVLANSCRVRQPTRSTPAVLGLAFEDVKLSTSDGLTLAGWWIPAKDPATKRTLLVCHGVGANRDDLFRFYQFLHDGGYHILTWDWRGHGLSDRAKVTFGLNERRDIRAAIDWVKKEKATQAGWLGAFAISMGAGIVLQSAREAPEIQAFVMDSPFASIRSMLPFQFRFFPEWIHPPVTMLTAFYAWLVLGTSIDSVAPIDHVAALAPRPLFLVHGTADAVIPHQQTEALGRAAGEPKEVWIVEGMPHTCVHEYDTAEYERRVLEFLAKACPDP